MSELWLGPALEQVGEVILHFNTLIHGLHLQSHYWASNTPIPGANTTLSKLDRVLLSSHWNSEPLHSFLPILNDLPARTSDHTPLKLTSKNISNEADPFALKASSIYTINLILRYS